ncbi:UNVERIFIED_CONTAM: hypothetical protein GTU68_028263 [Idotea baltica]|nr:hypothetical protein [Idotea baltica]
MMALAEELLADIDKETVDFIPNFDDSSEEPTVLPSRVPNLLVNGAEGIAVGMASKIPPHNLREVIAAAIMLVKNPEVEVSEIMEVLPGPDFPTGGIIYGAAPLQQIYRTGRGVIKIRGKIHSEEIRTGKRESRAIVIDELPFQTNKARLVEKIAELVNDKRIDGISKLRDESDRQGMRVVVELKRDAIEEVVINQLFKMTPLQRSFGVNMLAIVDGVPKVLPITESLGCFIDHRRSVIIRRSRYELKKAQARLHILDGYRKALDHIEEVIKVIRASDSTAEAKSQLIARFEFSDIQAQNILDMPLRRLTGLERRAIEDEFNELAAKIEQLTTLLASTELINKVIIEELEKISESHGNDRRTSIEEGGDDIDLEDLIAEEDMVVTISHRGYAKRSSPSLFRAQGRGGKGVMATKKLAEGDEDFVSELFVASTHAYLMVFTTAGKLYWIKVYNLPEAGRTARGRAIVNMLQLKPEEKVSAILPVRNFEEGMFTFLATKHGYVKRVDLMSFSNVRKGGIIATSLADGDELIGARLTNGTNDVILSSASGMAIRFKEEDVRPMGRTARGVRGIRLSKDDVAVNLVVVRTRTLLSVCEHGYGKRTAIDQYRSQGRGGKGLIDIKTSARNGSVVGGALVFESEDCMLITTAGKVIRMKVRDISSIGRNTMGVSLVRLSEGETVAAVARLAESEEEDVELDLETLDQDVVAGTDTAEEPSSDTETKADVADDVEDTE